MNFASLEYIIFFTIVFLIYWLFCPSKKLQNLCIVLGSIIFYGWCDWRFLGLLFLTTLTTFFGGYLIDRCDNNIIKKSSLIAVLLLNIGILFFFKYYNFFVQATIDAFTLFGKSPSISTLKILLPIGISFYTFSSLSYTIDVYKSKINATKDILAYMAYTMFFPSLLSGPISRANQQLPQYFERRYFNYTSATGACKNILMGGVMKLCLADSIGIYVDTIYSNLSQHTGSTLFLSSILYTIQIYADFAGYSLMAIGYGKLLGIELPINFNRPYFAKTVTEFWRRWHISLTTWFRDYIYFSLGGNRVSKLRWMLNTMIVFFVSGLWHGAAYTFIIWGILHGVMMIIERLIYGKRIKELTNKLSIPNILRILLTFILVTFAWIFFRAENFESAIFVINRILTNHGSIFIDPSTFLLIAISFVIVFIYDFIKEYNVKISLTRYKVARYTLVIILLCYILAFGIFNNDSFIYFQF